MVYDSKRIYAQGKKNYYKNTLKHLEEADISDRNKELILEFADNLFSRGVGDLRIGKLISQLKFIAIMLCVDFDKLCKKDVITLLAKIENNTKQKPNTKADYRRTLKQFYRWFEDEDNRLIRCDEETRLELNKLYKFIFSVRSREIIEPIDPSTILTEEDIELVIQQTQNIKTRALLKFLHETGVRAGELLNIKIKDIRQDKLSASVIVDGKTGMRQIFVTQSVPYLTRWLDIHPYKNNPESYVWVGESRHKQQKFKPLMHKGTQKLINRVFEKSSLDKKHNLHWFRHSRATLLAPHLTEALLCKYLGWSIGSRQVKRYVHLCNEQLEDAFLKMNGLKKKEEEKNVPVACGCGSINEYNAKYCYKCGRPLSVEIAIQDDEMKNKEIDKTMQVMMEIMQNPKLLEKFKEFKKDKEE
ncbi:site-specific integrase [archaeon]|jgi:site-specific recombinase XerD|nr:site-specific integrase [archaeon]MBT4396660.1 site-specific integrase [archaeon]MBT4441270.1 site-specific integrase [archaeon]